MQVSYKWLQELVPLEWSPQETADRLTMAGVAVEKVYPLGGELPGIVSGSITSLEKHPEADNLLVALMNVGPAAPEPLQVITGAANVKPGDKVPLALPGATMPKGQSIGQTEIKGVTSQGMMCSAEELGLEPSPADEGGIMILPPDTPVGVGIAQLLGFDDYILELDLTPNRGDCLNMLGVAREVAALTGKQVQLPPVPSWGQPVAAAENGVKVTIIDPELCPRYSMRIITDINIDPSPLWMQQRLRGAGMRPINNMVDVTNYVMLELGQPLHAFDRELIRGGEILVRRAQPGERLVTLDDQERSLTEEMLVIADREGPVGIAGVMGGANSEVTSATNCVMLESASFNNISIRKTAKALGLRSEASNRFEKGVDPNGTLFAATRAAYLMEELGAGKVGEPAIDVYPRKIEPKQVLMRPKLVNQLLGTDLSGEEMKEILTDLQFEVSGTGPYQVKVPTFRPDIEMEADLAEEVARIYGYNSIEETMLQGILTPAKPFPGQVLEQRVKDLLAGWGFSEIVTYSFFTPRYFNYLRLPQDHHQRQAIPLYNPLSEEQSVMRTTLLPSMIATMAANVSRKNNNLALFELGRVYLGEIPLTQLPREPKHLVLGMVGQGVVPNWRRPGEKTDFFQLKGYIEALLDRLGVKGWSFVASDHPAFHPGRQAYLYVREKNLGLLGEVHPDVGSAWEIRDRIYLAELDFDLLVETEGGEIRYRPLPRYPAVTRDIALVVDEDVTAARIEGLLRKTGGQLLKDIRLFDLYQGDQIPPGKKSLAYNLLFQAPDRTLTDEEVAALHQEMVGVLAVEVGATLRE